MVEITISDFVHVYLILGAVLDVFVVVVGHQPETFAICGVSVVEDDRGEIAGYDVVALAIVVRVVPKT